MDRRDFRFFHRLRVRWPEVDAQKIVFNGQYFAYFDVANSAYWRAAALPYPETFERFDGDTVVKKATLEYHGSAGYDDFIDVGMKCGRIGASSLTFAGAFFRSDTLLATAELVYVFVDSSTRRPKTVPESLRDAVHAFEAGDSPTRVDAGSWDRRGTAVRCLRGEEDADARGTHVVIHDRLGTAIAAGRLCDDGPDGASIGGIVVRPSMRGSGLGRAVVAALADAARERGLPSVFVESPAAEVAFFERLGFRADATGRFRYRTIA